MSEATSASGMCVICASEFAPCSRVQVTCGASKCRNRRAYLAEKARPEVVEENRERCRRWYAAKHGEPDANPWLDAAPAYGLFLPGGAMELRVDPHPRWPVEHRNVRALHGMLSDMTGHDHQQTPRFALMPLRTRFGWGVYVREEALARSLAGRAIEAKLYDRPVHVNTSLLWRLRSPTLPKRGRQRVRIDAITPVCVRNDGEMTYTKPTAVNFVSSLARHLAPRLGLDVQIEGLRVEIIESNTEPATVQLGGKYGAIRGWTGGVVLEVNAAAAWLIRCAALIGLGGRVAFGFGRIIVREMQ
jgi:hypothetical protein